MNSHYKYTKMLYKIIQKLNYIVKIERKKGKRKKKETTNAKNKE